MTSTVIPNDWLLKLTRGAILIARAIFIVAAIALAFGLGFSFLGSEQDFAELNRQVFEPGAPVSGRIAFGIVFALGLGIMLVSERFLAQLQAIIDTLPHGPFVDANARRFETMGWLALAMQGFGVLTTLYSIEVEELANKLVIDGDFSLEGLFLVLLLFIMARVFKHGAAMRDDLEGTV